MSPEVAQTDEKLLFINKYKLPIVLGLSGLILLIMGSNLLIQKSDSSIEFIEESTTSASLMINIKVDISGAVESPGVYTVSSESRIQDVLVAAGGLSEGADRDWVAKYVNLAALVSDGAKVYIPTVAEMKTSVLAGESTLGVVSENLTRSLININNASEPELDTLPGVGKVTADKIISGRPYSEVNELLTKKVVNKGTFEKIKDLVSVY